MTLEEYAAEQKSIVDRFLQVILPILMLFRDREVDNSVWEDLLSLLILPTARARTESAELARRYFEAQRHAEGATGPYAPGAPRPLTGALFRKVMNQSRDAIRASNSSSQELAALAARAVKVVENGGRETMLSSVHRDETVLGWARYDPAPPTCGFCWTMISRGPVYKSEESAGGRNQWHDNCTCKVVAVRDRKDWPGREQYLQAEKDWVEASRGAKNNDDAIRNLDRMLRPSRYRSATLDERKAA